MLSISEPHLRLHGDCSDRFRQRSNDTSEQKLNKLVAGASVNLTCTSPVAGASFRTGIARLDAKPPRVSFLRGSDTEIQP
jgi:hypothetical protein